MSLDMIEQAGDLITQATHPDANIIFGSVFDEEMGDEMLITVIATGFDEGLEGAATGSKAASENPDGKDRNKQGLGGYDDIFGRVEGLEGMEVTLQDILKKEEEEKGTSRFEIPSFL